ncbi:MAG: leucine-rich repeat domain-containing protein [Bacteroidales bacterium]|jgi:Leucine-rich repeat (LRR) protein|nr:leucine-rich repeat domain-containing protein [Bacteroidales bacterium]
MKPNVFLLNALFILFAANLFSQQREFYSLEEALKTPDQVRVLILKKQHLKSVPSQIYELKNLEKLSLSRNSIAIIPDSLAILKNLHYIDLSSNNITSLPCSLASLPLDTLVLWDNPLYFVDSCLSVLPVKYLDIRAIDMNKEEQDAILSLFPQAKVRKNHPCNCKR